MGGKKKTKWRKLPLEEFTKEIPTEKMPQDDTCQSDQVREENNDTPSYNETAQNYVEPYEYIDGLWYPTSCVVYNPAEVGLYSNYMMPVDTCYYYYTMPEMPQMQEYVPMPYQEYTSQLPKDTVYLVLPPQAVRATQPVQNVIPEWQNRRRRRRYEGYADYAVIPEKTSSNKAEEKDSSKKAGQYVNSRSNNTQSNNLRKMTSFSETNNFEGCNPVSEQNQSCSKSNEAKKSSMTSTIISSEKGPNSVNKELNNIENNKKAKKNLEMCGIHTKTATDIKELHSVTENKNTGPNLLNLENEMNTEIGVRTSVAEKEQKTFARELMNTSNSSQCYDSCNNLPKTSLTLENEKIARKEPTEQLHKVDDRNLPEKGISGQMSDLQSINQEINTPTLKTKPTSHKRENISQQFIANNSMLSTPTTDIPETQSSLPDILSTLNKPVTNEKARDSDSSNVDLDKGRSSKPKSLLSQTTYLPNLLSSDNEMEIELKQLRSFHSFQTNQSIYKLAYDENVTDQSEADSRSPSPIDPESQVPSSLTSAEILIHEADSDSEAGSEDVELLPHRYESETFLNENKHVYINKLSLAVELLRTQESLPYDDEFKRVIGENNVANNILPGVHTGGKVNQGFVEDSFSRNAFSITNNFENNCASASKNVNEVVSKCKLKHSADSSSDSAIFSDIGLDNNIGDELCEAAKEAVVQGNEIQDNTEEIRAGYRRFGVQAQHYFSPRAALSLNPCFCCIIM